MSEVMAEIHYDFYHRHDVEKKHRIHGKTSIRSVDVAKKVAEIMNEEYGEGSHIVVPLNHTWDEHLSMCA